MRILLNVYKILLFVLWVKQGAVYGIAGKIESF